MELTQLERIMLLNQFEILNVLKPGELYDELATVVKEGYKGEYHRIAEWLSEETPVETCKEVHAILDMFSTLELSCNELDDQSGLPLHRVYFEGFDANHELQHYSYAGHLKHRGLYDAVKNVAANSHARRLGEYRAMLERYQPYKSERRLTKDQIIEVVGA